MSLKAYEAGWRASDIGKDLHAVRNVKPLWSRYGTIGVMLGRPRYVDDQQIGFSLFGTLGPRQGRP
jgi:electron-transferring-flavoprotein dehydrogenase